MKISTEAAKDLLFAAKTAKGWLSAKGRVTKKGKKSIELLLQDAIDKAEGK